MRVEWDKPERDIPVGRTLEDMRSGVSPAFLPGRNAVFMTIASAEAVGVGANEIWIGVNAVDFSGYPDCRPEFIEAFRTMIEAAIPNGPKIVTPLLRCQNHRSQLKRLDWVSCLGILGVVINHLLLQKVYLRVGNAMPAYCTIMLGNRPNKIRRANSKWHVWA